MSKTIWRLWAAALVGSVVAGGVARAEMHSLACSRGHG
ncbi:MAG: hypothetical protein RJA22_1283, partial [Verrucomicrobiota bacterium]